MPLTMNWHYARVLTATQMASLFFRARVPSSTEGTLRRLLSRIGYRRCMGFEGLSTPADSWPTPLVKVNWHDRPPATWTASSRAPNPPTFQSRNRIVRAGHQHQDRESTRPDDPAVAADPSGSGHRVSKER